MPLEWVEPQRFVTRKKVLVYHTYRHETITDTREYWYTTDVNEDQEFQFDVRDLPVPEGMSRDDHKSIIRAAIDNKLLKLPDEQQYQH